jgi:hypothetical protein
VLLGTDFDAYFFFCLIIKPNGWNQFETAPGEYDVKWEVIFFYLFFVFRHTHTHTYGEYDVKWEVTMCDLCVQSMCV